MNGKRNLRIHGTYPFDGVKWRRLRELAVEEAASLLGICLTGEEVEALRIERAPRQQGDPIRWPSVYLFLNKGYIVINHEKASGSGLTALQAGMLEMLGGTGVEGNWPSGTRAVYLHDGSYYLIERVAP